MSRRKPTPAQVVVFPKRERPVTPTVLFVPETATVIMEEVITDEAEKTERVTDPKRKRPKQPKPNNDITDVGPQATDEQNDREAADELLALGHELFEKGRVREAKIIFEGLAVSTPEDAFVRTMLGTVSLALNDLPKALEHFEASIAIDPTDVAARVYRGELRLHKRKTRQAIEDFEFALVHGEPTDPFVDRARRLLKVARKAARK